MPGSVLPWPDILDAIARGVPENQARFAVEWGGVGPRAFDEAAHSVAQHSVAQPSAIGEALLASLVGTMRHAATQSLSVAHDEWERHLLARLRGEEAQRSDDPRHLAILGGIAASLRDAVAAVAQPVFDPPRRYWFMETSHSPTVDEGIHDTIDALDRFSDRLRTSLTLVAAVTSAETLELQRRAAEHAARFQNTLTILGSLILGPTLVIGLFGANVPLPLGGTWYGFALILTLAVISATVTWCWLGHLATRDRS